MNRLARRQIAREPVRDVARTECILCANGCDLINIMTSRSYIRDRHVAIGAIATYTSWSISCGDDEGFLGDGDGFVHR